ncbi:MAG TPA: hypothetical protein VGI03_03695 [Verrucomicrobiae bacterium]
MKTGIISILVGLGILTATFLHAQDTNIDWNSVSDLQVELQALEQVPPMPADEVTNGIEFWSVQHAPGSAEPWPPLPGNIVNLPVWDLSDGQYLLDDINFNYTAHRRHHVASHSTTNADGTRSLTMTADDSPAPLDEEDDTNLTDDSFSTLSGATPINTNLLWLQITNLIDGMADLNLYNATDYVYAVWSTTNLSMPFTNWNVEAEVFPSNTNCMPFTVQAQNRQNLFLQAEDWTGVTENGNTTPDWWFWEYYGTTDLLDTNLDSIGAPLLRDYQNNIDPNIIFFGLQFPEEVHSNVIDGSIAVYNGIPSDMAVMVNDTNPADAVWEPFTSTNLTVNLESGLGSYTISVGMRGMATNATITWSAIPVSVVPVFALILTNPAIRTVSQPMIQLQGVVNKTLSALTFDVSNALGVVTNQTGYWQAAFYDTNVQNFTTNTFQCYDVPLTNGLNTVTLHATDLAGDVITTNFNFTLDYSTDTNPPGLNILWPQNETFISGNSFTLQAQIDDDTATVRASINGQISAGVVERSGKVWVNDLPMAAGTNILTLTATDAAGNSMSTNVVLIQSPVLVTFDPLSGSQLNQSNVVVMGTISDTNSTYDIFVNGVEAGYVDDQGDWAATNVPVSPTGTAMFDVEIYTSDLAYAGSQTFDQIQPAVMGLITYANTYYNATTLLYGCVNQPSQSVTQGTTQWTYPTGGEQWNSSTGLNGCDPVDTVGGNDLPGGLNGISPTWEINDYSGPFYSAPYWYPTYLYEHVSWSYVTAYSELGFQIATVNAQVGIISGGPAIPGQKSLYLVQAQVFDEDTEEQIPGNEFHFMNQLPGTSVVDVTNEDNSVTSEGLVVGSSGVNTLSTPITSGNISFSQSPMTASNVTLQMTVVSNSATQIDATNWAVVKSLTNNYVYVQASFSVTNILIPTNAANLILWSGGEPVPGNPLQRMVTTTNSVETTVSASLTGITNSLNVWVIWSSVQILTSGTNPSPILFEPYGAPGNQLGVVYYSTFDYASGKICAIATITPAGIHAVVTNGWNFNNQYRMAHDFANGVEDIDFYDANWVSDPTAVTNMPDANDQIYLIDSPNIGDFASDSYEKYVNFYDVVTWNAQQCSSTNNFWHFQGRWKVNATPDVTFTNVGTGLMNLPTNSYYPPP